MQRYVNAVWILVGIYWAVRAFPRKRTIKRQSHASCAAHLVMVVAAGLLIWNKHTDVGVLGRRFVSEEDWAQVLGLILTLMGCAFAVWARVCLGANWSALVTVKRHHVFIRRGPYQIVRHPIYSGFLLALMGTALAVGEIRALAGLALAFLAFCLKSAREEQFLREEFGGEYARYSQQVSRLIPFVL